MKQALITTTAFVGMGLSNNLENTNVDNHNSNYNEAVRLNTVNGISESGLRKRAAISNINTKSKTNTSRMLLSEQGQTIYQQIKQYVPCLRDTKKDDIEESKNSFDDITGQYVQCGDWCWNSIPASCSVSGGYKYMKCCGRGCVCSPNDTCHDVCGNDTCNDGCCIL
eukprot:127263_1